MKTFSRVLSVAVLCSTLIAAYAQPGMRGPQFGGSMSKLFGDNSAFSATVEMQMKMGEQDMTMPGKISFDSGKSRFEMAMSDAKGSQMPPGSAEHMKAMGMDRIVTVSLPDKKLSYMIYPDMQAYAEMHVSDSNTNKTNADYKVETTELGKETLDGHPCVKNKAIVTDDKNTKHEYTVWNATDLKNFPVKIETTEQGHNMTMLFKDVKFSKPDAALFTAPADYQKYNSPQELMQTEMMKRMGGGGMGGMGGMGGKPPGHP
jgi:hypothetical protein